jgi:hypothetical protein
VRVPTWLKRVHENNESGATLLEFAIAFPPQLFVTLALMQFSLLLVGHVFVQHAAFAGARAALTADVPTSKTAGASPDAKKDMQKAAEKAAWFVLNPIAASDDELLVNAGVVVSHDFALVMPVVNHWFARAAGQRGSFFVGPDDPGDYNAESKKHKVTVLKIEKSAFIPRPWKKVK